MEKIKIEYSDNIFSYIYPIIRKTDNESVIIVVGGSGYSSVLGSKRGGFSTGYSTAGILNLNLSDKYDLLILEKPNLEPFEKEKESLLRIYTVETLSTVYANALDGFLSDCIYDKVIIFGHSEGGRLIPAIYNKLLLKEKVDSMIIAGAGGISQEEQFKMLIGYGYMTGLTLDEFNKQCTEIYNNPDSTGLLWEGHPYIRWASFLKYQYITEIKDITIPILLFQGSDDKSVPAESVRIVVDEYNLNGNITYIEVSGGHKAVFNNLEKVENWIYNN